MYNTNKISITFLSLYIRAGFRFEYLGSGVRLEFFICSFIFLNVYLYIYLLSDIELMKLSCRFHFNQNFCVLIRSGTTRTRKSYQRDQIQNKRKCCNMQRIQQSFVYLMLPFNRSHIIPAFIII